MKNRRTFLKDLTLLSSTLWAPTFLVHTLKAARLSGMSKAAPGNSNRILVVVELAGGCDGLNTLVPHASDAYYRARPNLAIPARSVLSVSDELGFHPALGGFKDLYDAGEMAIVQAVGYPNPNRSHFRSRDIWHTAEAEEIGINGWLAKYFDDRGGESLQGVNIGGRVPKAMISDQGSSPSITSIDTYQLQTDPAYPEDAPAKNAAFQQVLSEPNKTFPNQEYIARTILDATFTSAQILEGQNNYNSTVAYPDTAFATNLKTIAQIIAADLGVTVFYATIGGFDTHAGQIEIGDSLSGTHALLLDEVSAGLKAFLDDMRELGRQDEVLVMSFSEFGRRVSENASSGTDHGTANQMFLFGGLLSPGLYGQHPGLEAEELDDVGDMVYNVDFRSVYATVLSEWLGADAGQVLGEAWPRVPFL